jgi:hypothetical protein
MPFPTDSVAPQLFSHEILALQLPLLPLLQLPGCLIALEIRFP